MKTRKRKARGEEAADKHDNVKNKRVKVEQTNDQQSDPRSEEPNSDKPPTEQYTGQRNSKGEYHGRGTLRYVEDDVTYTGKFINGEKYGRGVMHFGQDGDLMEGTWVHDEMVGIGEYIFADQSKLVGTYEHGVLEGTVDEYNPVGKLTFHGEYQNGVRHGPGTMYFPEGTRIEGEWAEGVLEGTNVRYYYPDESYLKGEWEEGVMKKALFTSCLDKKERKGVYYSYDESDKKHLSADPLLPDLYEQQYVYVAKSTLPNAGEGLFAKKDLPKDFVCTFYNGIRVSQEKVDRRPWSENNNTITVDDHVIDIPPQWSSTDKYCASLAHKANCSDLKRINSKYDLFYNHPRFGKIKCIKTLSEVKKDEEIFVDYGYKPGTGPQWWRQLRGQEKS
jgi:histone-lysine N-methyltransferase SETD7